MIRALMISGLFAAFFCANAQAINCTCKDKNGDNHFTLTGYTGTNCNELVGDGNQAMSLQTPLQGQATCKDHKAGNVGCTYTLERTHMASCTTAP